MAVIGKNNRVDTPFDNYKERSKEPDGIHVGRVSAAPFFFGQKAVIFMVGVVLSLAMKCEDLRSFAPWTLVLFLMIGLWSCTVRLFVPRKNLMLNCLVNFIFVLFFGIGYTYAVKNLGGRFADLLHYNLVSIYDMYYLTPMAIAFAVMSDYVDERPGFKWNILIPTGIAAGTMLLTTSICQLLQITKGFVSIMFAGLILFAASYILSAFLKRGVYFAPAPQYDIFNDVPIREPHEFRKFVFSKLFLTLFAFFSVTVTGTVLHFLGQRAQDLKLFIPLFIALLMGGMMLLVFRLPLYRDSADSFELRNLVRYYEYPVICTFISFPFAVDFSNAKFAAYIFLVMLADFLLTGFIVSIPRRLILSNRSRNTTGAPAILLIISLIVMVGTVFFVIY